MSSWTEIDAQGKEIVQDSRLRKILMIAGSTLFLVVIVVAIIIFSRTPGILNEVPSNFIMFVGDGFGVASVTMARSVAGRTLWLDSIHKGSIITYSADSWVSDSSASATAFSCGIKTRNTYVAVDEHNVPCGTLLEAAKKAGKAVGIIVTSNVTRAASVAFGSHIINRTWDPKIGAQLISAGFDLILGGGRSVFEKRTGADPSLKEKAETNGYKVIETASEWREETLALPVLGLFSSNDMDYDIDRIDADQPSLAEMTKKAMKLLKAKSDKGFFLIVEGSRIEHAARANDLAAHYRDVIAYDEAVKEALGFANAEPDTLILGVATQEAGGLTLGPVAVHETYEWNPEAIANITRSFEEINKRIPINLNKTEILNLVESSGLKKLVKSEADLFNNVVTKSDVIKAIGKIVDARTNIHWSTTGYTGADVNLYATGKSSNLFFGNLENNVLGEKLIELFGFKESIKEITEELKKHYNTKRNYN